MKTVEEFRTEWLEALRSGKYSQAQGCLFINGCYCCLGVAAQLLNPEMDPKNLTEVYSGTGNEYYPLIEKALGVAESGSHQFVNANDIQRLSFSEIADFAETLFANQVIQNVTGAHPE